MNRTNIFFEIPIQKALYFLLVTLSFFELINGYFAFHFNTNLFGFIYKSSIIILAMLLFISHRWNFKICLSILCAYLSIIILCCFRLLRNDVNIEAIILDFQYTARSFLILISVFIFVLSMQKDKLNTLFLRFALFQWFIITIAIALHLFIGFGGVYMETGENIRIGYTSFFSAGNSIAIVYDVCWLTLLFFLRNRLLKLLITIITLVIVTAFASKLGILLVFFILVFNFLTNLFYKSKSIFFIIIFIFSAILILIISNFENIFWYILNNFHIFSNEVSKIIKIATEYGLISALWSRRDILISLALNKISNYNIKDLIIGINFFNYKKILGTEVEREFRMTEVDPIDLIGATGISGFILTYGLFFIIFLLLSKNKHFIKQQILKNKNIHNFNSNALLYTEILLMLFISSVISGHVFISPYTNILLGLIYGLIFKLSIDNNSKKIQYNVC